MTLTKAKTIQAVGQRTRLSNRQVALMLDALIEVWSAELAQGGRIEIENFLVLTVQTIERPANRLISRRHFRRVTVRISRRLRQRLNVPRQP